MRISHASMHNVRFRHIYFALMCDRWYAVPMNDCPDARTAMATQSEEAAAPPVIMVLDCDGLRFANIRIVDGEPLFDLYDTQTNLERAVPAAERVRFFEVTAA